MAYSKGGVARTKGPLKITRSDGSVEMVANSKATDIARKVNRKAKGSGSAPEPAAATRARQVIAAGQQRKPRHEACPAS